MALPVRSFLIAATALMAALVGGCGSSGDSQLRIAAIGDSDDPFEKGVRLSPAGQLVRASLVEGLVAFDEQGRVIPALADRWIVTDDGLSYIFRLRDGTWRDGSDLTARTARRALRSAIDDLRGTPLGLDLADIQDIREMAGRVIEIRLSQPAPHLLQLLAQPELGLMNGTTTGGPMRLERRDNTALLSPIPPEQIGLPQILDWEERARAIALTSTSGEEAVRRFNAGEAELVLGGRISTFPLTASVGILRGTIQLDPVEGLFGLQVVSTRGFLSEPGNREALALAIDREALIAPFGVGGWKATTDIIPASLEAGPEAERPERWTNLSLDERRAVAAARVAAWRGSQNAGEGGPKLSVSLPPGPGSGMLLARLKQDFAAIGVTLSRAPADERGDLRLMDVVARYPKATWYLNRFNCAAARNACSAAADEAMTQARKADDPAERAGKIAEASDAVTQANLFIPFGSPIRWSLVRSDAVGFSTNTWGWHPLMPMALLTK